MGLDECLNFRISIGWGLVHFFLWVSGRYWHDLSYEERMEVWAYVSMLERSSWV